MATNPKVSIVWHFFEKYKENGREKSKCRLCQHTANYHKNTTNLKDHLKRKHPVQLGLAENELKPRETREAREARETYESQRTILASSCNEEPPCPPPLVPLPKKQRTMLFNVASQTEVENNSLDRSLLRMVVEDYQPLSMVENSGFIKFVKHLQPSYNLPSRKKMSENLLASEYQSVFKKLSGKISTTPYLSITTDLWKGNSNKYYITITGHFISDFKMNSYVLGTEELAENHTASDIAEAINIILTKYPGSISKVSIMITDGSNILEAVTDHLKKNHNSCIAHTLNSFVQESITNCDGLNGVLAKCALHALFKYSNVASYKLKETQKQMQLPTLKLKKDIPSRWNSILFMLERFSEVRIPLSTALTSLLNVLENLDAGDWAIIVDIIHLLKPVHKITEELSREEYPTLSRTIPLIRGLQYILVNKYPITEVGMSLKSCLNDTIDRILSGLEENKSAALSTLLDPRFKKAGFGVPENATNAQRWLTEQLTKLIAGDSTVIQNAVGTSIEVHIEETQVTIKTEHEEENDLWRLFDQKVQSEMSSNTPNSLATLQVKQYLEMPLINRNEDPLHFWRFHEHTFNSLSRLAFKYLCIPATSVPSERVFTKAGVLANRRRNRLLPKKLDEIIFLNKNMDRSLL